MDSASLDGKTFAIVNVPRNAAMQSNTISSNGNLAAKDVASYLQGDATNGYKLVFGSENAMKKSGVTVWKFESIGDSNQNHYYVKTTVDGETKYLKIGNANHTPVTLSDGIESKPVITVTPGEGGYAGKFRLTNGETGYAANLYGQASEGIDLSLIHI